jgi:serine/threonine protein kinase
METVLAGRYQIVKHLGGGGFGQTFLASDSHLPGKPICVVKQLQPKVNSSETLEIAIRLFNREAETLYRLGNHDRIPRLLAHFEQNNEFYLVQEYVAGKPLDQEIVPGKRLSEAEVIPLLQDILEVLAFVHQQQVIHRDIKPANLIRRNSDGRIVLIDFGAVKEVSNQAASISGNTSMTVAIGSPGYMPIEQQASHPHFSSDIYSVGMVCVQALTGLSPRQLPRDAETGEFHCSLLQPAIGPGFAAILDRMVRYDYRQRYRDATEALRELQQLLDPDQANSYPTNPLPESTVLSPQRSPSYIAALENGTSLPETQAASIAEPVPQASSTLLRRIPEMLRKDLEQFLAGAIGPIAPVVIGRILAEVTTRQELTDRMISHFPEREQDKTRQRLNTVLKDLDSLSMLRVQEAPAADSGIPSAPVSQPATPTTADSSFVKRCELELTKAIGPIATLLVQRTLAQHPNLSQSQLIDTLAQHLPNPDKIEAFRRSLLASS